MSKIKLFTHTDLDGIGCAILAYIAFGRDGNVDVENCDYKNMDEKVEAFLEQEELYKTYDMVYITDISVSDKIANLIDILVADNENILLFDHHATALHLNKYPLWACVRVTDLDTGLKTSGTEMFYKCLESHGYFEKYYSYDRYLRNKIKRFVEIVRDYDTWRWKEELGEEGLVCKKINDLFYIYGRDKFVEWAQKRLQTITSDLFPYFDEMDNMLLEQEQRNIDIYVEKKDKELILMTDRLGKSCGIVLADRYISELGNRLCEKHPELDYVAMIDISSGTVSYRSVRDDIDLGGEIAHSFSGGGHKKAAGSTFDQSAIIGMVLREVFGEAL